MTLIKSISGIRGTIGGKPNEGLSPIDITKFTSAYAQTIIESKGAGKHTVVIGRDARISGEMVNNIVAGTLMGCGINVIDIGLATTPTVEMAVVALKAQGGIIITASHNPKQWNALKLLNEYGEFISDIDGKKILTIAERNEFKYAEVEQLGKYSTNNDMLEMHINKILELKLVDTVSIKKAKFKVAIDAVNSVGGIVLPILLKKLGVEIVEELYCTPNGIFPHNPEPLPENLDEISKLVQKSNSNIGFVVDPDVDRLAIICEDGEMFGEEYTLVAVSDYVLKNTPGNTVSNLSSTRALYDITTKYNKEYHSAAVGEVNVVAKMKEVKAIIGGEGNGGVIYPELHYGRDALVGIALFLSHLAKFGKSCSALRYTYPNYFISKNKIELTSDVNLDEIINKIAAKYKKQPQNAIDGLKIHFDKEWVHLRKSNTEPIMRIYSESDSLAKADCLANKIIDDIREIIKSSL